MNNGLTKRDLDSIVGIIRRYPEVLLVHLFGSRAKGTFKAGSDIDLAIMNEGVSASTVAKLKADFEESSLPYLVDLVYYPTLRHAEMRDHIDRVGVLLYKVG